MYSVTEEDGQALYGQSFHNSTYYTKAHHFNAAWQDADHIHEGLGFLPQHMKITNMFEKSMQAVDPSVSLFYWDFTIESTLELSFFNSPMFTADTFGSLTKSVYDGTSEQWSYEHDSISDGYIPDGRWAGLMAQKNTKYPELTQAYGYIRAPWNMNPNEYISRFSIAPPYVNLPGCGNYKEWFEDKDFSASMKESAYGPHSTTHTAIGGVYGCDALDTLRESGYVLDSSLSHQQSICLKWGFYIKEYYRGNYLTPDSDCTEESTSCFTCNEDTIEDMMSMMKSSSLKSYLPTDLSEDGWQAWQDFICHGEAHKIFVGDHLESASPADPSFWPVHPTLERLYQAKMMAGGFADTTWPDSTDGSTENYICDRWQCFEKTESPFWGKYSECCSGHFKDDGLLDFESGDRDGMLTEGMGGMVNTEILAASDPTNKDYSMPYVFDHFQWDHCQTIGVKIEDFVDGVERR
jgi:hypothetical protein